MHRLSLRGQLIRQALLATVGGFVFVPLWGLAYMAFDDSFYGMPSEFRVLPATLSLRLFERVLNAAAQGLPYAALLQNTLVVAGGTTAFAVLISASMAYAFARMRFPGRRVGLFALLAGSLMPPIALVIPLYLILSAMGIRTTQFGLMVVYAAIALPFCVWNMRAAFQAVPRDLEEAAFIDGASFGQTFFRITLPLALPAIGLAAFVGFLGAYSEFALGWMFVDRAANVTLAMGLWNALSQTGGDWNFMAAYALMMCAPIVVVFVLLQRSLSSGLMGGRVDL